MMASRNIKDLRPEFRVKVGYFLDLCQKAGLDVLVYCTLRPFDEQARLFRQSRPIGQIMRMKVLLEDLYQRPDLAKILMDVGPQSGPWRTDSAPGLSFHNFGLALDAAPLQGGKLPWLDGEDERDAELWSKYGMAAASAGLTWGGSWKKRDMPHIQLAGVDIETLIRQKV
jgi:peptidoglycan L-alanyl-D-glutamate endopeptidase CwlK